jgi:hypothetical protein
MATVFEIERLALDLTEQERAALAASLLNSLPGVLWTKMKALPKHCDVSQRLMLILPRLTLGRSWMLRFLGGVADVLARPIPLVTNRRQLVVFHHGYI